MLKALVNQKNIDFETIWTNKELKLGNKTIKFLTTPYLHWPETMSSYVKRTLYFLVAMFLEVTTTIKDFLMIWLGIFLMPLNTIMTIL